MKNTILNTLKAFGAFALLAGSCLSAQYRPWITVNVPFDFTVRNQHFDAGAYRVTSTASKEVMLVRAENGDSATFVLTMAAQRDKVEPYAKLVFNRYGERYFLSQVWPAASDRGRAVPPSEAEQELATNSGKPEVVALLVSGPGPRLPAR